MSYKSKDRLSGMLFKELLPFGGNLNENNQWVKLHDKIPWERLEEVYRKYFSDIGRPGKDSQLVNGLLIAKHWKGISDVRVVDEFLENPYIQYFCGYDHFLTNEKEIDPTTLCKIRGRLGVEYFKMFEDEVIGMLRREKIINEKEQMVDATVYPGDIKYPTDTGIIEDVRKWLVRSIKEILKTAGFKEKIRTYCRKARWVYLKFQKKRRKTYKEVQKVRKQLLQYTRRNIEQLKQVIEKARQIPVLEILEQLKIEWIEKRLKVAKEIYEQQYRMMKEKTRRIANRIVSFHKPYIRPIVRGKSGKEVEFGPKCTLSYIDGYMFLDKISFDAYHEGRILEDSINLHRDRFGREPGVVITDKIYGSKTNREMLNKKKIRASLLPLGRKSNLTKAKEKWVKKKQRVRNEIEGAIGNSKVRYRLDRLRYRIPGGEEINIRLGLISMNLSTMLARA